MFRSCESTTILFSEIKANIAGPDASDKTDAGTGLLLPAALAASVVLNLATGGHIISSLLARNTDREDLGEPFQFVSGTASQQERQPPPAQFGDKMDRDEGSLQYLIGAGSAQQEQRFEDR